MKLITNTILLLAASATAAATTTHGDRDNHQNKPHQLNRQYHHRKHVVRANTTAMEPNLSVSSV
jgi:nucleoside-specific outer membrane channel protein Tsx